MARRLERNTGAIYSGPTSVTESGPDPMFGLTGALPQIVELDLDWIDTRPDQPRKTFDGAALELLAESIREHGLKQPILVRQEPSGRYLLLAGERRLRAHRLNAAKTIVAIVARDADPEITALLENTQRADLNAVELACAVRRLLERPGYTQEKVAPLVGLTSHSQVSRLLKILSLPQNLLDEYPDHADRISRAIMIEIAEAAPEKQQSLWERAREGLLTSMDVRAERRRTRTSDQDGQTLRMVGQAMIKATKQVQTLEQNRELLSKEHLDGLRTLREMIDKILLDR